MAHFYRIAAAALLAATLVVIWKPARAAFPAGPPNGVAECAAANYGANPYASDSKVVSTKVCLPNAAGSATYTYGWSNSSSAYGWPGVTFTCGNFSCRTGALWYEVGRLTAVASCPANSTLSGSLCTCAAGYIEVGSTCQSKQESDNAACKALADGLNLVGAPLVHYGAVGLTACFGGFVVAGSGAASGGGQTELYGPFACSGANASACSVVPKPPSIAVTCPEGHFPGTVNGVQVCAPPDGSVSAPKTTTVNPPSPGASAPQIPNAPPGSTSEQRQTSCTGSTCTTTTTYRDASGTVTGVRNDVESKPSYCAANPKAPGCDENKSSFGGDCAAGFVAEGDAIQAAIAKELYRQNCLINQTTDESTLYTTEKSKTGDQTGTLPGNQTVTVGPGDFDSSDAIGGAACISDKTIVVWGKTIVMPFSLVCPALGYLKNILLAVSYLAAAGIVFGRRT